MEFIIYNSPVGQLTICARNGKITSLSIDSPPPPEGTYSDSSPVLQRARQWLDAYFSGQKPDAKLLPLAPSGTSFQHMIWNFLLEIPYGHVTTYGALARKAAQQMCVPIMSSQAVGGAIGRNPIALIIPCHRVIGTGGKLTGYAYGIHKKETLLLLEGIDIQKKKAVT